WSSCGPTSAWKSPLSRCGCASSSSTRSDGQRQRSAATPRRGRLRWCLRTVVCAPLSGARPTDRGLAAGWEVGFDAIEEALQASLEAALGVEQVDHFVDAGAGVVAEEFADQGVAAGVEFALQEVDDLGRPAALVLFALLHLAQAVAE